MQGQKEPNQKGEVKNLIFWLLCFLLFAAWVFRQWGM